MRSRVNEVISATQRMAYTRRSHEARLSNIQLLQTAARTLVYLRKASENSVCYLSAQFIEVAGSFARAQDDKRAGVFGRWSLGFKTSRFDYNRRTLINHFE